MYTQTKLWVISLSERLQITGSINNVFQLFMQLQPRKKYFFLLIPLLPPRWVQRHRIIKLCFYNWVAFLLYDLDLWQGDPSLIKGFSKWICISFIGHTPHFSSFVCHLIWLLNSFKIKVWLFRNHFIKHYTPFATIFSVVLH